MVESDVMEDIGIETRESSSAESAIRRPRKSGSSSLWVNLRLNRAFRMSGISTTTFWVLDTEHFDISIGGPLISKYKLLKRIVPLWFWPVRDW
jgi:hypothetical protein